MIAGVAGIASLDAAAAGTSASALDWSWNPWRENAWLAVAAAASVLALCALIVSLHEPLVVALALALAAVATLSPLLVVVRCHLDESGVVRGGPGGSRRRAWSEIRRASFTRTGLLLSPATQRHRLDSWRALYLPIPAAGRDARVAEIRALLERHGLAG